MLAVAVNLDRQRRRWDRTQRNAGRAGVHGVRRVRGVDGRLLPTTTDMVRARVLHPEHRVPVGAVGKGWIGNYLGIRRALLAAGDCDVALLLEDDVFFARRFQERLREVLDAAPEGWPALYLGLSYYAYPDCMRAARKLAVTPSGHGVFQLPAVDADRMFVGGNFAVLLPRETRRKWLQGCLPLREASDVRMTRVLPPGALFVYPPLASYYRHESDIAPGPVAEHDPGRFLPSADYDK